MSYRLPHSVFRLTPYVFRLTALLLVPNAVLVASPCGSERSAAVAWEFLREINALREKRDLAPLRLHPALCEVARERARELSVDEEQEFDLLSDEELFRRADTAGYNARFLAELEIQADGTVSSVVSGWPSSARETALEKGARDLGVGVGRLGDAPLYALFFGLSQEEDLNRRTAPLANRESVMREMLERVNRERKKAKLRPLRLRPELNRAAQRHAEDMYARAFYGHETPEGRTPLERVRAAGYAPLSVAENVARGQVSVEEVMDGWMDSKVHRVNILGRDFSEVGFGLAYGVNATGPTVLWVQVFGAPVED